MTQQLRDSSQVNLQRHQEWLNRRLGELFNPEHLTDRQWQVLHNLPWPEPFREEMARQQVDNLLQRLKR